MTTALTATLVTLATPSLALANEIAAASQAYTWNWKAFIAWLFASRGGSSGATDVPELGAEGIVAAAVVVLTGAALVLERRRRSRRAEA